MDNNKGHLINSTIRPSTSADTFSVAYANELKGGFHNYSTLLERDNIPLDRRQIWMKCTVAGTTYLLSGGTSNINWVVEQTPKLSLNNDPFDISWSTDVLSGATRQAIYNKFNSIDTALTAITSSNIFNNGLTKVGNIVSLGGSLTGDTKITGTNYNLSIGELDNEINNFDVFGKISLNNKYGGWNVGNSGFNSYTATAKAQPDGKILVGGAFTTYNGSSCSAYFTRLNTDGTLDTSFNSGGTGFGGGYRTYNTTIQPDGKILVGGAFTTYNGSSCSAYFTRLNTDGTLDTSFNSGGTGFNGEANIINIQPDGKILVGGAFTTYNGSSCSDYLVRLNADGTLDTLFNSGGTGFNLSVGSLNIQPDGKILVGGNFTLYNGIDCSDYLVRLNADGTLDTSFNSGGTGFDNDIFNILIQPDGKILVGGEFTIYNGINCPDYLVRLNIDGTLDTSFNSGGTGFNGYIYKTELLIDNKILVGGEFGTYNGNNCSNCLVRLNTDGTLDTSFNSGGTGFNITSYAISSLTVLPNEMIVCGGFVTNYNGTTINNMVKLSSNGSLVFKTNKKVLFNGSGVLRYESNYHDEYIDRTLPDVGWVKNYVSGNTTNTSSTGINNTPYNYSTWSGDTISGATRQALANKFNTIDNNINSLSAYTLSLSSTTQNLLNTKLNINVFNSYSASTLSSLNTKISQSGNTFGTNILIGTNDNFDLQLETNGIVRQTIANDGLVTFNGTTGNTGIVQMKELKILDFDGVTFKTALDSPSTNTLRLGNGFTAINSPVAHTFSSNILASSNNSINIGSASFVFSTINVNKVSWTSTVGMVFKPNATIGSGLHLPLAIGSPDISISGTSPATGVINISSGNHLNTGIGSYSSGDLIFDIGTIGSGSTGTRGNISLMGGSVSPAWNGLQRGIYIANVTSVATGNPSNGYYNYSSGGTPYFHDSTGNIIKLLSSTTGVTASTFVSNTSGIINDSATYGGYTMGQIVTALKVNGFLI